MSAAEATREALDDANVATAGVELINALIVDPGIFYKASEIRSSDFPAADGRAIWFAAQRAANAGEEPDAATLIEFGVDKDLIKALVGNATTTALWKTSVAELLKARRHRSVATKLLRAQDALKLGNVADVEDIMAEADEDFDCGLGNPFSAKSLCENPSILPPEIIAGMLYGRGTMMLSGPSKSRKTYTFLDMAFCVAWGIKWLGFATTKQAVIYLNLELAPHSLERRLLAISKAKGVPVPDNLHVLNLRGKQTTLAMLRKDLPRMIKKLKAGLVILDPWYKIAAASGADENSNDGQSRVLSDIESIVNEANAALVIGHHFAKGNASGKNAIDRAAGAGAMARWGDVIATLTEHEEDDAMVLEMALRDFAPVEPMTLRWNQPLWEIDASLDSSKLKLAPGRADEHPASQLFQRLTDGMTNPQWFDASGWTDGTYRRKRAELVNTGKVIINGDRYYRRVAA